MPRLRLPPPLRNVPVPLWLAALVLAGAAASTLVSRRQAAVPGPAPPGTVIRPEGPSPAEPVEAAFEAARRSELDAYFAQFAEPLRAQLARTRAEKGDAYFRNYLQRLTAPLKGIAVRLSEQQHTGPATLLVPVEFVYQDRNEVQTFELRREGGGWRILRIEAIRAAPTLIPYGTPVQEVR